MGGEDAGGGGYGYGVLNNQEIMTLREMARFHASEWVTAAACWKPLFMSPLPTLSQR